MRTLNLGILAHVDAGKTTLTEQLLYTAGVIEEPGSVDHGSTQTDTLALERRRGITIKSAVVSFVVDDVTVNLIDTPGHPDFIAEVERVLSLLDGAVLVVSAVEGVQAQTRVLLRALRRLGIPTLIFVNKTDRVGADVERAARGLAYPKLAGSAKTGEGVDALMAALPSLGRERDPRAPLAGTVFKIDRGRAGEKIAYMSVRAGTVRTRDRLPFGKVTAIRVFERGADVKAKQAEAGQIAKLWGLADARIGDTIGEEPAEHHFAPPTLETVVVPANGTDRGALHVALTQLAEQDPLINLRDSTLSLYGEVQKEVIQATLADDFGVEVSFRGTTAIHISKPAGTGAAFELIGEGENPYLATVGLRVEPGSGVEFRLEVELGSMPAAFFTAVEETVYETLRRARGITDCLVTMTHSGYWARQSHSHGTFDKSMSSTAGDFRALTPRVLHAALARAGTDSYEPVHRFTLELPDDTLGDVLSELTRLRALPQLVDGAIEGTIPVAHIRELQVRLPALTRGEGVLETGFAGYVRLSLTMSPATSSRLVPATAPTTAVSSASGEAAIGEPEPGAELRTGDRAREARELRAVDVDPGQVGAERRPGARPTGRPGPPRRSGCSARGSSPAARRRASRRGRARAPTRSAARRSRRVRAARAGGPATRRPPATAPRANATPTIAPTICFASRSGSCRASGRSSAR